MSLARKSPRQDAGPSTAASDHASRAQGENAVAISGPGETSPGADRQIGEDEAAVATDNPAKDNESENPEVVKYKGAVKDIALYTADYQDYNYGVYLEATHMAPALGKTPLCPHIMILFREFLQKLIETMGENYGLS